MGFFELIKSIPAILSALLELKKLWDQFIAEQDRQAKMKALGDAIKEARETHDPTKLTDLVNSIIAGEHMPPGK